VADKEVGQLKATVSLTTTEFNKGIETLSKQMSIVREEFKLASGSLDKVKDAMQISKLKADELTQRIDIQKKIVAQMSEAHKYAAERFGEGSKQAINYELKLKKSETTLQGLEKQLASTSAQLNKQGVTAAETAKRFQELGVTWQAAGQKFTDTGKVMSVAITAPILAAAGAGLKFDATIEDLTTSFETMLGSADEAKSMLKDITQFAKDTPFEMPGLADAAKVLLNFSVQSEDVMTDIGMLGDVALGNQDKFNRLTLAFGQIQSTGRLMGQDLNQLINAGFNPLQVISQKTGRSMADLKKDMEAGAIS
jgi:tape measure domain-containing protein